MKICEHEKNIVDLIQEFGDSCNELEIREWYNIKKQEVELKKYDFPIPSHITTYTIMKEDLTFSFPDNIPKEEYSKFNQKL